MLGRLGRQHHRGPRLARRQRRLYRQGVRRPARPGFRARPRRDRRRASTRRPRRSGPATARCLILVTPDAQRTMNTFLGACVELGPEDIDAALIDAAQVTYLEGYLFDPPRAKTAFRKAAQHRAQIGPQGRAVAVRPVLRRAPPRRIPRAGPSAISTSSSPTRSRSARSTRPRIFPRRGGRVSRPLRYRGADPQRARLGHRHRAARRCRRGRAGRARSWTPPGAGDLYAAGFLFGLTHGLALPDLRQARQPVRRRDHRPFRRPARNLAEGACEKGGNPHLTHDLAQRTREAARRTPNSTARPRPLRIHHGLCAEMFL